MFGFVGNLGAPGFSRSWSFGFKDVGVLGILLQGDMSISTICTRFGRTLTSTLSLSLFGFRQGWSFQFQFPVNFSGSSQSRQRPQRPLRPMHRLWRRGAAARPRPHAATARGCAPRRAERLHGALLRGDESDGWFPPFVGGLCWCLLMSLREYMWRYILVLVLWLRRDKFVPLGMCACCHL